MAKTKANPMPMTKKDMPKGMGGKKGKKGCGD